MKKLYFFFTGIIFSQLSYSQSEYKDVAPIFYSRCTSCHHEGGGAPFSLTNYSGAFNNMYSIQSELQNNTMPPWHPDTTYSRFLYERLITQSEKNDILNWINAGAPAGDTTLAPAPPVFPQYKLFGTPDLVLKIPTFVSKASSADTYVCFVLPTNFTQDRILRAFEIVPGNPGIVHHVVTMVDTTNSVSTDTSGSCYNPPGDFGIGGYVPGDAPTVLPGEAPLKAGIRLPSGSKIVMQMHYPQGTAGQSDSTQIRMYFYPVNEPGVRNISVETPLQNWSLFIPANSTQTYTVQTNVPSDVSVISAAPHSHKVCTKIINYAFKNNDTIPLIRINNWDFEWQGSYTYKNPLKIPAGYKLFSSHFYDNTTNNPDNPSNPPQLVTAGPNTTNEMLFDGFQWMDYQTGDENIDIGAILANDSLLNPAAVKEINLKPEIFPVIYPNPNNGIFTVALPFKFTDGQPGKISIYNILGEKIYSASFTSQKAIVNLAGEKEGIYFFTVNSGNSIGSGKIIMLK